MGSVPPIPDQKVSANVTEAATPPRKRTRSVTTAHVAKLEQIKQVATELFYREGYSATDLRRIGDGADMHVSTLYNYISGKEELLFLILLDGMREIQAGLDEA